MIHNALSKSEIAFRYYKIVHPEKNYPKEEARKRFHQDKNIDLKIVSKIIDDIHREQKEILRKVKKMFKDQKENLK